MANNSKTKETQVQQPQKTYLISSVQLTDIMRYLMSKPYAEVVKIMNMLATLNQLNPSIGPDFIKKESVTTDAKK
jgi:hypothetical protein